MESGWYAGNIYSAISSTRKFNSRKIEKSLTPLRERCSFSFKIKQHEHDGEHRGKTRADQGRLSFNFWF
jgi:hypothetical protein